MTVIPKLAELLDQTLDDDLQGVDANTTTLLLIQACRHLNAIEYAVESLRNEGVAVFEARS